MGKRISEKTMSRDPAPQVHEAFSRLVRCLRAVELPYGLTSERLSTLASVAIRGPISVSGLAEAEFVSLPTMSRMVARLEEEDFVRREENESDHRGVLISATAKGKMIYKNATRQSLTDVMGALAALNPEQLAVIRTLLSTVGGQHLPEQADEAERLYNIAPVGLCYFDTDLRFLYINDWLANINGLTVAAHLGHTIDEVLQDVAVGVAPQLRHVIQTGEPILDGGVEAETPAHPGESRHYRHNYYPDMSDDGTVVGVSCVVQDISDRIEREAGSRPDLNP